MIQITGMKRSSVENKRDMSYTVCTTYNLREKNWCDSIEKRYKYTVASYYLNA